MPIFYFDCFETFSLDLFMYFLIILYQIVLDFCEELLRVNLPKILTFCNFQNKFKLLKTKYKNKNKRFLKDQLKDYLETIKKLSENLKYCTQLNILHQNLIKIMIAK